MESVLSFEQAKRLCRIGGVPVDLKMKVKNYMPTRSLLLYMLCWAVDARHTVELGCGKGFTSFGMASYSVRAGGTHIAVDQEDFSASIAEGNTELGLSIEFIRTDATKWVPDSVIDFCYLDLVDYSAKKKAMINIGPLVGPGGVVVSSVANFALTPDVAWDVFSENEWDYLFIENGFHMWKRKEF